jgi:hypothetical protein
MKSARLRNTFLALALLWGSAGSCGAADLTAFVGGVKPGKLNGTGLSTPLDSSPIFGVRVGGNFIPFLGMECTLAFSSDYLFPHIISNVTNARGFVTNGNLMFNIPVGNAVPYLTAGIGIIRQYGSENLPVGTKFAVNYGGGVKFRKVLGPLGLRLDARGYTAMNTLSRSLNMLELSAGVLIGF